jgi:hypothetical protein
VSEKTATGTKEQVSNRHLVWQQCQNTRNLGGFPPVMEQRHAGGQSFGQIRSAGCGVKQAYSPQ